MGIVSFSPLALRAPALSVLLAPVQSLLALFVPSASASGHVGRSLQLPTSSKNKACSVTQPAARTAPSRLKIVREYEAGVGPTCAGRMVISGRMADVCAELDRMAQRESASLSN